MIIGGFFKREVFKTLKVGLVLFQNSLVNGSGFGKVFGSLTKNNLLTPVLKDVTKWLFINENAIESARRSPSSFKLGISLLEFRSGLSWKGGLFP